MGLVQYEIEKAGFSTISLANVPDFTVATCAPRIAAIERPFGRVVGEPGDREGQMVVVRGALEALKGIEQPGEVVDLQFSWDGKQVTDADVPPPPITTYLMKHMRQALRFMRRDIPEEFRVD